MVRVGRRREIFQVAIHASIPDALELQRRSRGMALFAAGCFVYARQREAVLLVQFGDVVHHPMVGRVAAGAVRPDGLLVDILVASVAVRFGLRKNQRLMAGPAVGFGVLAFERESRFAVMKTQRVAPQHHARRFGNAWFFRLVLLPKRGIYFPARRRMAGRAVGFQLRAVWTLGEQVRRKTEQETNGR